MGENPIKETIKLISRDEYRYLELKADGSALYIYDDGRYKYTEDKFQYTYDTDTEMIYMRVEKSAYWNIVGEEEEYQLLTYDELVAKINEDFTVGKLRQSAKKEYEENKDEKWFKEDNPDCDTYEKYEAALLKEVGFNSLDDYVKDMKRGVENQYKAEFGAQITYSYEIKDGKITLTPKFTGVKNLLMSGCYGRDESTRVYIYIFNGYASIRGNDYEDEGTLDTDNKTITFKSEKGNSTYKATYTENLAAETVTINCEGKEYVCEFEGKKFIQE